MVSPPLKPHIANANVFPALSSLDDQRLVVTQFALALGTPACSGAGCQKLFTVPTTQKARSLFQLVAFPWAFIVRANAP